MLKMFEEVSCCEMCLRYYVGLALLQLFYTVDGGGRQPFALIIVALVYIKLVLYLTGDFEIPLEESDLLLAMLRCAVAARAPQVADSSGVSY